MSEKKQVIKYDYSEEELRRLGFVDADGVVVNFFRYEHDAYYKECMRRAKYRNEPELIAAGIVDKNGKVLNEKRLQEYQQQKWEKERAAFEAEQAAVRIESKKIREQSVQKVKALLARLVLRKNKSIVK